MARYRLHRTITVSGFSADADPRTTPPSDALLFEVQRDCANGLPSAGHAIYFRALTAGGADVTTANVTFMPWMKDEASGAFVRLSDSARTHAVNQILASDDIEKIWIQITALSAAGASTVQCWVAERATVAFKA